MENRERDRVSQRNSSTDAGDMNRKTEQERGKSGTGTEFGQNIGRSENLGEGGNMENRNKDKMNSNSGSSMENEQSRRPSGDSGFGSSSGRSSGSSDIEKGDLNENQGSRRDRGDLDKSSDEH